MYCAKCLKEIKLGDRIKEDFWDKLFTKGALEIEPSVKNAVSTYWGLYNPDMKPKQTISILHTECYRKQTKNNTRGK